MSSHPSAKSNRPTRISPLAPASILEMARIKVCIIGTAALRLFGLDLILADLNLAVADKQFDSALSLLHNHSFQDINTDCWQQAIMPGLGKPGGWDSHRLMYPPSSDIVALTPASCWHLNINPDTTFLLESSPYRFPDFLANLEALIRILNALQPIGGNLLLVSYYYSVIVELLQQQPDLKVRIAPGEQFFIDFYMKQLKGSCKLKVLEFCKQIIESTIMVETAREVVLRPDLARKWIKEKYLQLQAEVENSDRNTPVT
ncbi:hypothetical protein L873DRAFT_1769985 [Choiromyces venosus 120613-1]|uniref:Uncharacterized protein n=1 Tax=Choiromyces venosus 120613-1 TaxID=1336337 RepID=A0A3N4JIJ4_9PEZI|nr:hypothetical protein L873DRAFT_1769985 [Choiromyces venosus 120613-1]